jgi:DNA-3-methyladenine glycosylase II
MPKITLRKPRGFMLESAAAFYADFTPGCGMAAASTNGLTLALRVDRSFEPAAVRIDDTGATLTLDVAGTADVATVRDQVARILGLEGDADAWSALGREDAVVGKLQAEFPGFFTAAKSSPYDAAAWAVLAPRMPMRTAASVKLAMSRVHGAAPVDALPLAEPRVLHGLAHVLGASAISPEEFVRRAERFRPFRMWVAVLLSRHLARTDGWRAPSLGRERARAGRALSRRLRRGSKDYGESAA